jgi:hypothetical protein
VKGSLGNGGLNGHGVPRIHLRCRGSVTGLAEREGGRDKAAG